MTCHTEVVCAKALFIMTYVQINKGDAKILCAFDSNGENFDLQYVVFNRGIRKKNCSSYIGSIRGD